MSEIHELNEILTPEEVAKTLNVSLKTVYRLINRKNKPLPAIKLGHRTIRILRDAFLKWLETEKQSR